jgi:hypothetical protein
VNATRAVEFSPTPSEWALREANGAMPAALLATTSPAPASDPRIALHRWYADWSTAAKTFVGRRDWLIRMGLLRRRRRESLGEGDVADAG